MLIPTKANTRTITDIREDAIGVVNDVTAQGILYVTHHSLPQAVMMSIDEFVAMQEMLEDYQDLIDTRKLARQKRGAGIALKTIQSDE